jgi:hypothetical protein
MSLLTPLSLETSYPVPPPGPAPLDAKANMVTNLLLTSIILAFHNVNPYCKMKPEGCRHHLDARIREGMLLGRSGTCLLRLSYLARSSAGPRMGGDVSLNKVGTGWTGRVWLHNVIL